LKNKSYHSVKQALSRCLEGHLPGFFFIERERERERGERWNLGIEACDGLGNFLIKHKNNRSYAQNPRLLSVQKNHTS
jgi:hypothetical protein